MTLEVHPLPQDVQEVAQRRGRASVGEELLLRRLAAGLVDHAELEGVDEGVLIVGGEERRALRRQGGAEALHRQLVLHQLEESIRYEL